MGWSGFDKLHDTWRLIDEENEFMLICNKPYKTDIISLGGE